MQRAFIANTRAMRPPTSEMMNTAINLVKVLDKMTANNMTANNTTAEVAIATATSLFKTWHGTEIA
jgi:hypothetical protein